MTLNEYIALRLTEGTSKTATIAALTEQLGVSRRSLWNWANGADMPRWAEKMLTILTEATPEQRKKWFS